SRPGLGPGPGGGSIDPSGGRSPWQPGGGLPLWTEKETGPQSGGAVVFPPENGFGGQPGIISLIRIEYQRPEFPLTNAATAGALAVSFSAQRMQAEPGETGPSPTAPGNLLIGSNPVGPQGVATIVGHGREPGAGRPSAPLAPAG